MRLCRSSVVGACFIALLVPALPAPAQTGSAPAPAASQAEPEQPSDPLGRSTPRGTVLGFLSAARKGEYEIAAQYLNTSQRRSAAEDLANQLFVVLDTRLPPRLTQLSDAPRGSLSNPLAPDQELVGTIAGRAGPVEIVVERVDRAKLGTVWLFSRETLEVVPALYGEIVQNRTHSILPSYLINTRVAGIPLFEWLALLFGLPLLYFGTVLLNRVLTPLIGRVWLRLVHRRDLRGRNALPAPARLLLLALAGRWLLSNLPLSLVLRQFWANTAALISIVAVAWLLILLNGEIEEHVRRRLPASKAAARPLLRVGRRTVDVLVLLTALFATLRHLGVDPTPALAGLGVGGIAVALAAQKTLENVIAGASLIFDQAVRVGDFLRMGDVVGTVDHVGLRSTRIRTLDRTVVTVPNSQIANASLETFSVRDKFWFHPVVALRYDTTPGQLHAVVDGIRRLLEEHRAIDPPSVRVRLLRLGAFSLDIDVFAYVHARDWDHFLEIQEALLFSITELVNKAGTAIALPSQTMYMAGARGSMPEPDAVSTR